MTRAGLLAVGVGFKVVGGTMTDEPCVKTFVPRKLPVSEIPPGRAVPGRLPSRAGSVATDVDEMLPITGPPWLGPPTVAHWHPYWIGNRGRHRPMSGGDSVSHPHASIGTVSTQVSAVFDPAASYILSCNHVLAALNRARPGDPVVQPAAGDGGRVPVDVCGTVERWAPILFGSPGYNRVDAAIARVDPRSVTSGVDWVGRPTGTRPGGSLRSGEKVWKVGRTTLLTSGTVVAVNVSGWIFYPSAFGYGAFFERQIVTTPMAAFGDSGSLLIDAQGNAVGLLFGGSPTQTLYNDIVEVQRALAVSVVCR